MTNWHEKLQENYASSYSSQLLLLALWSHKCCLVNKLESLHIDYILCCLFSKTSEIFLGLDLFLFSFANFPSYQGCFTTPTSQSGRAQTLLSQSYHTSQCLGNSGPRFSVPAFKRDSWQVPRRLYNTYMELARQYCLRRMSKRFPWG